jgi:hypothetical protein
MLSIFFSEEKKQKTFVSGACGKIRAMASIMSVAEEKSLTTKAQRLEGMHEDFFLRENFVPLCLRG